MAGIDSTGFIGKALPQVKADLETAFKQAFGASIDISPESVFGQLIGINAEREADLWSLAQDLYTAFTADGASATSLDNIAALTGTLRAPAFPSTVVLYLTGTNTTVIPAGRAASVVGTGTRFQTLAAATLATAAAWAGSTAYVAGDVRRNGATQRCYLCTVAGASAASGGPSTVGPIILDGGATWLYLGDGAAFSSVNAQAQDTGPKVAASGTLTTIETPVAGWSGVVNPLDASLGADAETDAALRIRRESELRGPGKSTVGAIRTALFRVAGVTAVNVFENVNDTTDADGITPHSVEALVSGGTDAAVRSALFASVAAGIQTYGTTSGTYTDSQTVPHTVKFSRPAPVNVYVSVSLVVDAGMWPVDGPTQLAQVLVKYGAAQRNGKDVVAAAIIAQCFTLPGVLDASALISTAPSPSSAATIPISPRQIAVFDTSRITVASTPGIP